MTNAAGCDSVITLDLTINTVDNSVTNSSPTLTANAVGGTYQWLDCDNSFSTIPNETNQSFIATSNGNYAVIVSYNGCIDTSACESVNNVLILQNSFETLPNLYPNPTSGNLTLDLGKNQDHITIKISMINGQLISIDEYKFTDKINFEINQARGVYIIEITNQDGNFAIFNVLKQ